MIGSLLPTTGGVVTLDEGECVSTYPGVPLAVVIAQDIFINSGMFYFEVMMPGCVAPLSMAVLTLVAGHHHQPWR